MVAPVISVVVPSERRRVLQASVRSLTAQVDPPPFQVVVVLDGPNADAAAVLSGRTHPFETTLLEQSQRGLQHARDLGASAARGEFVLFLDEGATTSEDLLARLAEAHGEGADAVQVGIGEGLAAVGTVAAQFTARWVARRSTRLAGSRLTPFDICLTPLSLDRRAYARLRERTGPPGFTHAGIGEDFRVGMALDELGVDVVQLDVPCRALGGETADQLLGLSREIGLADAALCADDPARAAQVVDERARRWATSDRERKAVEASPARARLTSVELREELVGEARRGRTGKDALARFERALAIHYWLGFGGYAGGSE